MSTKIQKEQAKSVFMYLVCNQKQKIIDKMPQIIGIADVSYAFDPKSKYTYEQYVNFTAKLIAYKLGLTNGR